LTRRCSSPAPSTAPWARRGGRGGQRGGQGYSPRRAPCPRGCWTLGARHVAPPRRRSRARSWSCRSLWLPFSRPTGPRAPPRPPFVRSSSAVVRSTSAHSSGPPGSGTVGAVLPSRPLQRSATGHCRLESAAGMVAAIAAGPHGTATSTSTSTGTGTGAGTGTGTGPGAGETFFVRCLSGQHRGTHFQSPSSRCTPANPLGPSLSQPTEADSASAPGGAWLWSPPPPRQAPGVPWAHPWLGWGGVPLKAHRHRRPCTQSPGSSPGRLRGGEAEGASDSAHPPGPPCGGACLSVTVAFDLSVGVGRGGWPPWPSQLFGGHGKRPRARHQGRRGRTTGRTGRLSPSPAALL